MEKRPKPTQLMKHNTPKANQDNAPSATERTNTNWELRPPFGTRHVLLFAIAVLLVGWSGLHVQIDQLIGKSSKSLVYLAGLTDESEVAEGFGRVIDQMLPPSISQETPVERISNFDPEDLPRFSEVKVQEYFDVAIDYNTLEQDITVVREETLVEPFGYLF